MKSILIAFAMQIALASVLPSGRAAALLTNLPINKCLSGKIAALGKSIAARTGCLSKGIAAGTDDSECLDKASDKFTGGGDPSKGAFNRQESKYPPATDAACPTFNDQSSFEVSIDTFVRQVPPLTGSGLGKCDAGKIKCFGKYLTSAAKCHAKAAAKSGMVDSDCTSKVVAKLADGTRGCLDKAAANLDCSHPGNQAAELSPAADAFLLSSICSLAPGTSGCATPGPTSTPSHSPTAAATPSAAAATPTATAIATATATATASSACGNGLLEAGESCTSCPADCVVQSCTATTTRANFDLQFTASGEVTAVVVDLAYRDGLISLPGTGSATSVRDRVTNLPSGGQSTINDRDYSLRVVKSRTTPLPFGRLMTVSFDRCRNAAAPTTSDLACVVASCSDAFSLPVANCTCTVSVAP